MTFTSRLAEFAIKNKYEVLPENVVNRAKEMMVNAAGVALAAAAQPDSRLLIDIIQDLRGNGKCTIIGMGLRTSPTYAALANGMMINLLDFDDEIIPYDLHISSTIMPVVMAIGEMNGCTGKQVISAYVTASEIMAGLAHYCPSSPLNSDERPCVHMDGVLGTIGACIAAGLMHELEQQQLTKAIGIAAGCAGGIFANYGTPARAYQCGQAAMNGFMSSYLAANGMTGSSDSIESSSGLMKLFWGNQIDSDEFFSSLASPYRIETPGVALKLYPCDTASHTAIEALLQLLQQYRVEESQVDSVLVSVTQECMNSLPVVTPSNGWESRFCMSYIIAATLLHGQPLLDFFSDAAVADTEVRHVMDKVTVQATEGSSALSSNPCTVSVVLKDGKCLENKVDFARGQPELPLDKEEIDAKFLYCTRYILPPDHIEEAIDSFRGLENVENVTGMFSVLGG
tara:strand:+ start:908 stop:2272 length:1365 start_codon:yes stop_codon:yes gene_type:complete